MKQEIEFEKIGKNIPYEVPEDFFDNITQKTLQEIKRREQYQKKFFLPGRIVAVAASFAILISIVFFLSHQNTRSYKTEFAEQNKIKSTSEPKPKFTEKILEEGKEVTLKKKAPVEKITEKPVQVIHKDEKIDDLLVDLSEEDLLQLAAIYKTDLFNE
jgi:hypothetical protein